MQQVRFGNPFAMRMSLTYRRAWFFLVAVLLLGGMQNGLWGQSRVGKVSGLVSSVPGKVIAGAKITLRSNRGSWTKSTITTPDGTYTFAPVPAGTYSLTAEAPGFAAATRQHIGVQLDHPLQVDLKLAPLRVAGAGAQQKSQTSDSLAADAGYYDNPQLKPSAVAGAVDAGGYSSPGQAQTSSKLLQGVASLKNGTRSTGGGADAQPKGMTPQAAAAIEAELKKGVAKAPGSFDAHHRLGEFYVHVGKLPMGIPYLEHAQHLDASHYDNGYDLALAYLETHNLEKARAQILLMIARQDTAELHNLLGEVQEGLGQYIDAANQYERAAHMEPSVQNIFDWGSELLLHLTFEPAVEVFKQGVALHPRSPELLIGLGVALYSRGGYDDAIKALSAAADLKPSDPTAYLFLGRMYNVSTVGAEEVTNRLARFIKLQPQHALGRYYYAMSVWKGQRGQNGKVNFEQIESLLKDAIALDPKLADAHLELGTLFFEQRQYPEAITEYQQAIKLKPDLGDAHYRLAQAYSRTGDQTRAREEFEIHGRLHKQQLAETEKQRAEIKQFVYSMKDAPKP